jgi:murein DD-endopeptidase MepM/ murein hydrolase activator NlpD
MTGRVTDAASGAPIRAARVDVPQLALATLTDSTGAYTVTPLPAGRWVVRVRAAGYAPAYTVAGTPAGGAVRLHAAPHANACPSTGEEAGVMPRVTFVPTSPAPGDLVQVLVTNDSAVSLSATLFGQPVTFVRDETGHRFVGLGAVPLDSTHDGTVALTYVYPSGRAARGTLPLVITKPEVLAAAAPPKREALHVAAQFAVRPTGATEHRVAAENEVAHAVGLASLGTQPLWDEPFIHPRPGRVTSPFGGGRQFNGKLIARHTGTDFAGQIGDSVGAANRGVVALVGDFFLAGTVVYIDHGGGLTSAYFHLSAVNVTVGDTVQRGQRIGSVGATGRVTGPHLHWVVRYGGTSVNPLDALTLPPPPRGPVEPACPG